MDPNRTEQIRNLITNNLQQIQDTFKDELEGSDLELQLKLFLNTLKNKSVEAPAEAPAETSETPVETSEVAPERPTGGYINIEVNEYGDEDDYDDYDVDADDYFDEDDYESEPEPLPVPAGFPDEETYQAFLDQQEVEERPDDMYGVIPNANGGAVEVGNMDDLVDKVNLGIQLGEQEYDMVTGELVTNETPEVPVISVSFTRQDAQELREADVLNTIMPNRISGPMKEAFGENYTIVDGDSPNEKIAVFYIDQNNPKSKILSQGITHTDMLKFNGTAAFVGLGLVKAKVKQN